MGKVSLIGLFDSTALHESNGKLPQSPSRDNYVIAHLRINLKREFLKHVRDCYSMALSQSVKSVLPSDLVTVRQ